ncbi:GTPase HflX [Candidatus Peregrinibacteria bacterium CG10_big_fil_rev_8_21_14_0_10_36_19]|nr:MAG: GTPase HflX [Candidatus Peregrinibacteria bacterium CG10_big_fil_rev_8_21_14_0_10_36_19]
MRAMNQNNKKLKAVLVDVIDPKTTKEEAQKRLEELESLVQTFGGIVVLKTIQQRVVPDYETYVGKGKLTEIKEYVEEFGADVVVLNNIIKPRQIYALNEAFQKMEVKVWDRVDMILKIFSKHAKSTEAKLQIELASIRHMGPRIFGMGIELSRQAGAMGVRAGQGESNTELMKRHLSQQELNIVKKLEHYDTINKGHRQRRKRQNYKTAALVGYTNAGKSSLLNSLTGKKVYIADELFATLSTRVGKLYIPSPDFDHAKSQEILIADTIGFIRDLPPGLIKAFKSTLAETVDADLLLHVIDITDPDIHQKIDIVEEVLEQLGLSDKPKIYIFNKTDLISPYHFEPREEDLDEEHKAYLERPGGILPAGEKAAKMLGWHNSDIENRKFMSIKDHPKKLSKKYKKFNPVFLSAHKKERIEDLIEILKEI